MLAVNGYYDGNVCVLEDKVTEKPQKVIITFLEKSFEKVHNNEKVKITEAEKNHALKEIQGFWKMHDNSIPVDEYIRNIREGRKFDI